MILKSVARSYVVIWSVVINNRCWSEGFYTSGLPGLSSVSWSGRNYTSFLNQCYLSEHWRNSI